MTNRGSTAAIIHISAGVQSQDQWNKPAEKIRGFPRLNDAAYIPFIVPTPPLSLSLSSHQTWFLRTMVFLFSVRNLDQQAYSSREAYKLSIYNQAAIQNKYDKELELYSSAANSRWLPHLSFGLVHTYPPFQGNQ